MRLQRGQPPKDFLRENPVRVLGLMSGTSLDGVDVAVIETDGERVTRFGPALEVPLSKTTRKAIRKATKAALRWNFDGPPPNGFAETSRIVDDAHIQAVERFAERHPAAFEDVALIGYHGQTVLHRPPEPGRQRTLQLGDGQALAERFGRPCVFDFRSNDMAHGGQGAPLAPAYHRALVRAAGLERGTAVLNLGGVGNATLFAPAIAASDTGPGNGPLDQWMKRRTGKRMDKHGRASAAGTPDTARVRRWLDGPFFRRPVPRAADRYDFVELAALDGLSVEDGAATLARFTAESVARTLSEWGRRVAGIVVCGGGRRNPAMLAMIAEATGAHVVAAEGLGWDGDALEAQAFAFLAARSLRGLPLSWPGTTGVCEPVSGGVVAWPATARA